VAHTPLLVFVENSTARSVGTHTEAGSLESCAPRMICAQTWCNHYVMVGKWHLIECTFVNLYLELLHSSSRIIQGATWTELKLNMSIDLELTDESQFRFPILVQIGPLGFNSDLDIGLSPFRSIVWLVELV
jgi:hypothetical protein